MSEDFYRSVAFVAERMKSAKEAGAKTVILTGAGCSVSSDIPLADGFVEIVRKDYPEAYASAETNAEKPGKPDYFECMGALQPAERLALLKRSTDKCLINWAHLCIATLIKSGYVDKIVTTNFDPLAVRACALLDVYPAVYDMATGGAFYSKDYLEDDAVLYLHGQRFGFVQIMTIGLTQLTSLFDS